MAVRPMKDGVIADFDVTEEMLSYFIQKVTTASRCVPASSRTLGHHRGGEARSEGLRDRRGRGQEVIMIAEPMAAAIGVGLPVETPRQHGHRYWRRHDRDRGHLPVRYRQYTSTSGSATSSTSRSSVHERDYNLLIGEPTAEQIKIQIGSASR